MSFSHTMPADSSLINLGILDSMSILELIDRLEQDFFISFSEDEFSIENFESIKVITSLLQKKLSSPVL